MKALAVAAGAIHGLSLAISYGGPVFAKVVEIGAREDLPVGDAGDRAVKIGLAEEAAVHGIGAVGWIGKFPGRHDAERPILLGR